MYKVIILTVVFLSVTVLSDAADYNWKFLNSKTTPEMAEMLFGPPSIIKTEMKYSDWIKNKEREHFQPRIFIMSYYDGKAGSRILNGPLGKASEVEVVIENGKVINVVWIYSHNQKKPAYQLWKSHKEINKVGVSIMSTWKIKGKGTVSVNSYTGGEESLCYGPITVDYLLD